MERKRSKRMVLCCLTNNTFPVDRRIDTRIKLTCRNKAQRNSAQVQRLVGRSSSIERDADACSWVPVPRWLFLKENKMPIRFQ